MKATSTLRPSASSPRSVHGPSASTCPASDALALAHHRPLVHAGVLVRALELGQRVDVRAEVLLAFGADAHDDALRVDQVDDAIAPAADDGARIAGRDRLHPGPDERGAGPRSAAPPGAACSSPSARGWRRRSRGTGSATPPPTRAAWARRRCSAPRRGGTSLNSPALRALTLSLHELARRARAWRWPGR